MLSVLLYDNGVVALLYLLSGHSHMLPDRATAHRAAGMKNQNIYHPKQLVEVTNSVKGLSSQFLDHNASKPPFFIGWENILNKYFTNLPGGYTNNYFFEFKQGTVTVRYLADTPDADAWSFEMCAKPESTKKAILKYLFGVDDVKHCTFDKIRLERHAGNTLKPKKVQSLAKKYFTIPTEYIDYYPILPDDPENNAQPVEYDSEDEEITVAQIEQNAKKKRRHKGAKESNK